MNWISGIAGCFGSNDKIFAGQYYDCQRAAELLSRANAENIGWGEYHKEIENWLKSQECSPTHIEKQMQRVSNLRNYFNYD